LPQTSLRGVRLAAVGPSTAAAARDALGLDADVIPDEFSSAALAQVLTPLAAARILLPLSSLADTALADALRAQGASVTRVVAYQTVIGSGGVDLPALLRRGGVDAITLTSSSAATNLARRVANEGGDGALLRRLPVACIGERTAKTARGVGLWVVAAPTEHTLAGLVASLAAHFLARRGNDTSGEGER
jgi:uroporphyrinogen-III synthase